MASEDKAKPAPGPAAGNTVVSIQSREVVEPVAEIHDRILEAYYGKMGDDFMRKTQERIHWICENVEGRQVLDIGCSQGIVPILLAREGKQVTGIDSDSVAIQSAQGHLSAEPDHVNEKVRLLHGDFLSQDFAGASYDTVIMSEVLEHLVNPRSFVAAAADLVGDAGRLIITVPFGINDFIDHKRTYYLLEPYRLLARYFDVTSVRIFGRWIGLVGVRSAAGSAQGHAVKLDDALFKALEEAVYRIERENTSRLTDLKTRLDDANKKYRTSTEQVTSLKQKIAQEETARTQELRRLTDLQAQVDAGTVALEKLKQDYQAQISTQTREVGALNELVRDSALKLLDARGAGDLLRTQLETAQTRQAELAQQLQALKDQAEQASANFHQATVRVADLQARLDAATAVLADERARLQDERARHESERGALSRQLGERTDALLVAEKQILRGELAIENLSAQLDAANARARGANNLHKDLQNRLAQLEPELATVTVKYAELKQRFDAEELARSAERETHQAEIKAVQQELRERLAANHELEKGKLQADTALKQLGEQLAASAKKVSAAEAQIAAANVRLADLTQRESGLQNRLATLQDGLADASAQHADLKQTYDASLQAMVGERLVHQEALKSLRDQIGRHEARNAEFERARAQTEMTLRQLGEQLAESAGRLTTAEQRILVLKEEAASREAAMTRSQERQTDLARELQGVLLSFGDDADTTPHDDVGSAAVGMPQPGDATGFDALVAMLQTRIAASVAANGKLRAELERAREHLDAVSLSHNEVLQQAHQERADLEKSNAERQADLTARLSESMQRHQAMRQDRDGLAQELAALSAASQVTVENLNRLLQREREDGILARNHLQADIQELQKDIQALRPKVGSQQQTIEELHGLLAQEADKYRASLQLIDQQHARIGEFERENAQLHADIAGKLHAATQARQTAEEQRDNLAAQLVAVAQEHDARSARLGADLAQLQHQLDVLNLTVGEQRQTVDELQARIAQESARNHQSILLIDRQRAEIERLEKAGAELVVNFSGQLQRSAQALQDLERERDQLLGVLAHERGESSRSALELQARMTGLEHALVGARADQEAQRSGYLASISELQRDLNAQLGGRQQEIDALQQRLAHEAEQHEMTLQLIKRQRSEFGTALGASRAQLESQQLEAAEKIRKLSRTVELREARLKATERREVAERERVDRLRAGTTFRTGAAIIAAGKSFRGALGLPAALLSIYRDAAARRKAKLLKGQAPQEIVASVHEVDPPQVASRAAVVPSAPPALPVKAPNVLKLTAATTTGQQAAPGSALRALRVAAVMDEFTYHSFAPECNLLQLRADTWQKQLDDFRPELVFVESAWRGLDDSWQKKISDVSPELLGMVDWAHQAGVPVAFWCKEDPIHFERFIPVARLVDVVFTTDADCIPKYCAALGHERVYLLPFAAQPAIHNPIEANSREDAFCFAGSYYTKYVERQENFKSIAMVARRLKSLVIYDRNAERPRPHDFEYPEEYHREILGSLPYTEIDRAYKGYRYGITVNTIKQSQTMFARRAFELMACNTVVVSNYAKGLRLLFGDLVIASDSEGELAQRLAPMVTDDLTYRRHRLNALRAVLSEHTYGHRLAYVVGKMGNRPVADAQPRVCMYGEPADAAQLAGLVAAFERQSLRGATLVLLVRDSALDVPAHGPGIVLVSSREQFAAMFPQFDLVAPVCPLDHYGVNYLKDMVLSRLFTAGGAVTKSAHFVASADAMPVLAGAGAQYTVVKTAAVRCSLVRADLMKAMLAVSSFDIALDRLESDGLVALDEFHYCKDAFRPGHQFAAEQVDVAELPFGGLSMDALLGKVELRKMAAADAEPQPLPLVLDANEWGKLLPSGIDGRIEITPGDDGRMLVQSRLGDEEFKYVYLTRRFTADELKVGLDSYCNLDADARMDLRLVLVYEDAAGKKISHVMHGGGAYFLIQPPAHTDSIKLGLRIKGHGISSVGAITLAETRHAPLQLVDTAPSLVIANNYPSYNDYYKYGFVHARVRAYRKAGLAVDVMRLSAKRRVLFREFENVEVVEAEHTYLKQCVNGAGYKNILIHLIDQRIWAQVKDGLDHVRVAIWVHGAEIQPWWRRASNFAEDAQRDRARQDSDARLAMWREIVRCTHPNLRLIFISNKQMQEAFSDLQIPPQEACRFEVIPNYINADLFVYRKKEAAHRRKILSIRPFASRIYANDLTVDAILILSKLPFFHDLQFRIVGDGALFDEVVAPLRKFANVELQQGFLSQREIAELHKDYGVFLVPSRMDSQGVSRDEAMASGLVPVTTRIAAIPEFVDSSSAILAEPEDAQGLARGIQTLYESPELFLAMSDAAARRVRRQSGYTQTIAREIDVFSSPDGVTELAAGNARSTAISDLSHLQRVAVYGDVNLNIMDGSAVWAASVAETFAGIPNVHVSLFLKARIQRVQVIDRLIDLAPRVQLIEPVPGSPAALTPVQALAHMKTFDVSSRLTSVVLRGLNLCVAAAQDGHFRGRIWAYLTDIPQQRELLDDASRAKIELIVSASQYILCQTPQMERYFVSMFPTARQITRLLPPMIPPIDRAPRSRPDRTFRWCYAGKFAPQWGILDMFGAFDTLNRRGIDSELHIFGDKIHRSADHPDFHETVSRKLVSTDGLVWHGAVGRDELLRGLGAMQACWAFRDPNFERTTLELSTKALEYAALGVPTILARSPVFESVFGVDYQLFADSAAQAVDLLTRLASDEKFCVQVSESLIESANGYTFEVVRAKLQAQQMFN